MKTCFIIMPFSRANNGNIELQKVDLDYIYKDMIKKAIDEFELDGKKYFVEVLRYEERIGSIIKGIVQKIKDADMVVADLTGLNSNVMYELGVRHALKRGTIMLTQNFSQFPSDLRDYMTVVYNYSTNIHEQPHNYENFKQDLYRSIEEIIKSEKADSPVLEYINKKELYQNELEVKNLKETAIQLNSLFEDFDDISTLIEEIDRAPVINEPLARELMNFNLNCFISKLQSLNLPISSDSYNDWANITAIMTDITKNFVVNEIFKIFDPNDISFITKSDIKSMLSYKLINPILLKDSKKVEYCTIREMFSDNSFVLEFLDDVIDFLIEESKNLGVESEIDEILIGDSKED